MLTRFLRPWVAGLALPLLTLTACTKDQDQEEIAPETGITGRVLVAPQEFIDATGRKLGLSFRDEGQYTCSSYGLLTQYQREGQQLTFTFSGVDKSSPICLTSIGPAKSWVALGDLPAGTYALKLRVGTRLATGSLELTSTALRVQTDNSSLVAVSSSEIRFTPPTAIWGHVLFANPADQPAAKAVADSLQRQGAAPLTLPAGPYASFEVGANGQPTPPTVLPGVGALPLLFSYSGDFARVRAVISRAKAAHPSLNMYLTSYKHEAISN